MSKLKSLLRLAVLTASCGTAIYATVRYLDALNDQKIIMESVLYDMDSLEFRKLLIKAQTRRKI